MGGRGYLRSRMGWLVATLMRRLLGLIGRRSELDDEDNDDDRPPGGCEHSADPSTRTHPHTHTQAHTHTNKRQTQCKRR